ncbi:RNA polymerase sigma factor [Nocardioides sp. T2.26MG-1]|uniref:RNA polymerase sigma factor n=1 Tax=Nocardioides sp. T2.26MG-1 TaxID=3041166 RepID=UPI0024774668|nr:sigma-70 family RNA polymerase sigma factor [Nocardioides sp. T2.26MG-1]CAI9399073.1 ECF RNA polymerase sigma factor ShbA [Nocardioides sp. T2.26MG-1]
MREGAEVVARARTGDESAWAELYADHAERLVVWLQHLHQLDAAVDAEDIAAEAWLTAARRIADFSGDGNDFAGWLFGIARNISRNRYRTTRSRGTAPLGPRGIEDLGGCIDDHAGTVVGDDLARRLVGVLPEREGQVIACIDVVGLDVAATSRALGLSPGTVRVAHHRGLRRLRRLLGRRSRSGSRPDPVADVTLRVTREM